jgi:ribosomal protein S1
VVSLSDDVEGFVPTSQLAGRDLTDPTGVFKEGEQIPLHVIEFDQHQHKVVLSVIAYYKKRERDEFEKYLAQHRPATAPVADVIPESIKVAADEQVSTETAPADSENQPVAGDQDEAEA